MRTWKLTCTHSCTQNTGICKLVQRNGYVHPYIDVVHTCVYLTGHFVTQTFLPANYPRLMFPSASLSSPSSYLSPTNCLSTPVQPVWAQWRRQNHWETVCKDDPFLCWLHSPGEEEVPQETEGGFQAGRPSECKALERGSYVCRWLWYVANLIFIIHCIVPVCIRTGTTVRMHCMISVQYTGYCRFCVILYYCSVACSGVIRWWVYPSVWCCVNTLLPDCIPAVLFIVCPFLI